MSTCKYFFTHASLNASKFLVDFKQNNIKFSSQFVLFHMSKSTASLCVSIGFGESLLFPTFASYTPVCFKAISSFTHGMMSFCLWGFPTFMAQLITHVVENC